MIPMRTSTIFKSRWMALLWAAGIIWLAIDLDGGSDSGASPQSSASGGSQPLSDEDNRTISDALDKM